jgi:hypothetical protein
VPGGKPRRAPCAFHPAPVRIGPFRLTRQRYPVRGILLAALVLGLYVLHPDWWNWTSARPLVFGFIPLGLFYHAAFSIASSACMALLVRFAWPGHLERFAGGGDSRAAAGDEEPRG